MSKLKSCHFDCGNSSTGSVGMSARVRAHYKTEAVAILNAALPECSAADPYGDANGVEYIRFYAGTVKVHHIDSWEDVEDE